MLKGVYKLVLLAWGVASLHLLHQDWGLTFCVPGWNLTWEGFTAWAATTGILLVGGAAAWRGGPSKWVTGVLLGGATFPVVALAGGLFQVSARPDWLVYRPWLQIRVHWPGHTHAAEYWESFYGVLQGRTNPHGVAPVIAHVGETLARTREAAVEAAHRYLNAQETHPVVVAPGWTPPGWVLPVALMVVTLGLSWWFLHRVQAQFNEDLNEVTRQTHDNFYTALEETAEAAQTNLEDTARAVQAVARAELTLKAAQIRTATTEEVTRSVGIMVDKLNTGLENTATDITKQLRSTLGKVSTDFKILKDQVATGETEVANLQRQWGHLDSQVTEITATGHTLTQDLTALTARVATTETKLHEHRDLVTRTWAIEQFRQQRSPLRELRPNETPHTPLEAVVHQISLYVTRILKHLDL